MLKLNNKWILYKLLIYLIRLFRKTKVKIKLNSSFIIIGSVLGVCYRAGKVEYSWTRVLECVFTRIDGYTCIRLLEYLYTRLPDYDLSSTRLSAPRILVYSSIRIYVNSSISSSTRVLKNPKKFQKFKFKEI